MSNGCKYYEEDCSECSPDLPPCEYYEKNDTHEDAKQE